MAVCERRLRGGRNWRMRLLRRSFCPDMRCGSHWGDVDCLLRNEYDDDDDGRTDDDHYYYDLCSVPGRLS